MSESFSNIGGLDIFVYGGWDLLKNLYMKKAPTKAEIKEMTYPNNLLVYGCNVLPSSTLYEDETWKARVMGRVPFKDLAGAGDFLGVRSSAFVLAQMPTKTDLHLVELIYCALGAGKTVWAVIGPEMARESYDDIMSSLAHGDKRRALFLWVERRNLGLIRFQDMLEKAVRGQRVTHATCVVPATCEFCKGPIQRDARFVYLGGRSPEEVGAGHLSCYQWDEMSKGRARKEWVSKTRIDALKDEVEL